VTGRLRNRQAGARAAAGAGDGRLLPTAWLRVIGVALALVACAGATAPASAIGSAPPAVETAAPSLLEQTGAVLHGFVSSVAPPVSDCHFEYGTTTALGSIAPCMLAPNSTAVSGSIYGLLPGTAYLYRLVASDAGGTSYGPILNMRTPNAYSRPLPTLAEREQLRYARERQGGAPLNPNDVGLHVAFCPRGHPSSKRARSAGTSEAGWPPKECLKMDKGEAGKRHTLVGERGVHNWLLGGYGNDTIIGGDRGDVIWADYHPDGEPAFQSATIRAGNGRNVIYANDTVNYVWTGTNPKTVVHAHGYGIGGVIHCQSPGVVLFLSTVSEKHFKLDGCHHISHYSVGY
jgi:hypothetical protein